ncbi:hypothetical protein ATO9_04135 [Pseudooceanicola atlanticus]|uniref:Uncharacterized protein n=1 Tax=Pseudooceanicola atlanticus TaxID=1461694 RepID=A0A0A0EN77_9RHOB|nr:hypothetical protein ATO9_04135 [Pseudooceanicola atlanticus]
MQDAALRAGQAAVCTKLRQRDGGRPKPRANRVAQLREDLEEACCIAKVREFKPGELLLPRLRPAVRFRAVIA